MQQRRIRLELLRATMKLPGIAQQNLRAPAKGPHHAANPNILRPELAQIPNRLSVPIRTHYRKPALLIRCLRTAKIQKPRPIGQLHHVVDMGRNADILVLVCKSLVRRIAGLFSQQHQRTQRQARAGIRTDTPRKMKWSSASRVGNCPADEKITKGTEAGKSVKPSEVNLFHKRHIFSEIGKAQCGVFHSQNG